MTTYFKNGSSYTLSTDENVQFSKSLPVGHYTILFNPKNNQYYLDSIDSLKTNTDKIYGDVEKKVARVVNSYFDRPGNTGVLLTGEKGSGKTLLAKLLATGLLDHNCSTLLVNQEYHGEDFNNFLQMIKDPCMILFDEFEKVYSLQKQQELLTLLDGTYSSKKLFVVTCNEEHMLSKYVVNRPGRLYYRFEYSGLEESFVREYCQDNLNNKNEIEKIVNFTLAFGSCNFDILKALVEEMNRYDEPVSEVIKYLNATPMKELSRYKIIEFKSNEYEKIEDLAEYVNSGGQINAFTNSVYIYFNEDDCAQFDPVDIVKIVGSKIHYQNEEGTLILEKESPLKVDAKNWW